MKKIVLFIIVFTFYSTECIYAQYGSYGITDAQSVGIGNSTGNVFSTLAIGKNPALLDKSLDSNSFIAIQFPNIQFKALESSMSIDDFNKYFNYPAARSLNAQEKSDFYNSFDEENGFYFNLGSKVFAIAVKPNSLLGTFALSATDYVAGNAKVPLTLIDLIVNGNAPNKTYKFDDMNFNMWWFRTYSLSWGKELLKFENSFIKNINVGLTAKYVSGFAYAGIEKFNANLTTGENHELTGKVNYLAKSALSKDFGNEYEFEDVNYPDNTGYMNEPAGSGFGFDIGFSAELGHNLNVGLAITDIGSINWDSHSAEYKAQGDIFVDDLFDKDQRNELENFLEDSSYSIESFSTSLPTALRFHISYGLSEIMETLPGKMNLHLGYAQGFNNQPGNSTSPRISLGMYWDIVPYLPSVMTGFTNNRAGDFVWSLGLGYSTSFLDVCIATQNLTSLLSSTNYPHASLALNFIWNINM